MKKLCCRILLLLILFGCSHLFAQHSTRNGVGVIIGNPTGISIKFLNSGGRYFNAAIAWSAKKESYLQLHADYIFNQFSIQKRSGRTNFKTYLGAGLRVSTNNDNFGFRIPFGISYIFSEVPVDLFLEIVPAMDLIPATEFDLDAGLGIRFLF